MLRLVGKQLLSELVGILLVKLLGQLTLLSSLLLYLRDFHLKLLNLTLDLVFKFWNQIFANRYVFLLEFFYLELGNLLIFKAGDLGFGTVKSFFN